MRALPGVRSAAASSTLPLSGNDMGSGFVIAGRQVRDEEHANAAQKNLKPPAGVPTTFVSSSVYEVGAQAQA